MRINEIFYSLQGEGARSGTANVFVRFTGCNLKCRMAAASDSPGGFDCDSEFASGRDMTETEVLEYVNAQYPQAISVIFTGGEPALQLTSTLVAAFKSAGLYTAIETNGTKDVTGLGLDWITVSPKVAEHAIKQLTASEVRYVRGHGQAIPKTVIHADRYYISPAFDGDQVTPQTLSWCVQLVKDNPMWRLSLQQHKFWGVR